MDPSHPRKPVSSSSFGGLDVPDDVGASSSYEVQFQSDLNRAKELSLESHKREMRKRSNNQKENERTKSESGKGLEERGKNREKGKHRASKMMSSGMLYTRVV